MPPSPWSWMSVILGSLFMGISLMAYHYGIIPKEDETVVSIWPA